MRLSGREFGKGSIELINHLLTENPGISRRGLSRRVCEELDWRSLNGRYQEVSCRKALLGLDHRAVIRLPEAREGYFLKSLKKPGMRKTL